MKRPHFHLPRLETFQSLAVQTSLEIAAGGVLLVALMRWMEM